MMTTLSQLWPYFLVDLAMMLTMFMLVVTVVTMAMVMAWLVSVRVVVSVRALLASKVDMATFSSV